MEYTHTGLADAALVPSTALGRHGRVVRPFTVAVDIDGVLYEFVHALRMWRHRTHGIALADMPEPGVYDIETAWGMERGTLVAEMIAGVQDGTLFWQGAAHEPGIRGLRALRSAGCRIVLVTARALPGVEELCREATEAWLTSKGLACGVDYDELILVASDKTGIEWDLLVDDYEKHVRAGVEAGRHAVLLNRGWNTGVAMRQAHWDDIPALVASAQADVCKWECCPT